MKKFLLLLLAFTFLCTLVCCTNAEKKENGLYSDDIDSIIISDMHNTDISITDKEFIKQLSDYIYVGQWNQDNIDELFIFPGTRTLKIYYKDNSKKDFFILRSGDIVFGSSQNLKDLKHYKNNNSDSFEENNIGKFIAKYGGEEYDLETGKRIISTP